MNQTPAWLYLLIAATVLIGGVYATPNLFGNDPALQVSTDDGEAVSESLLPRVTEVLSEIGITPKRAEILDGRLIVRMADTNDQLRSRDPVAAALGKDFVVALNLAPATPQWLRALGGKPMYLGLDLRGGVQFLMEVDTEAVQSKKQLSYATDIRSLLREEDIKYVPPSERDSLVFAFRDVAARDAAREVVADAYFQELDIAVDESALEPTLVMAVKPETIEEIKRQALEQNISTLRNRVNELGVAEPVIQQQGLDRILVQLPGVQDSGKARETLGATATLEFRLVDTDAGADDLLSGRASYKSEIYPARDGTPVALLKDIMLSGERIIDASSGFDQEDGSPNVNITLDGEGASQFSRKTRDAVGKPMGVLFIENESVTEKRGDQFVTVTREVKEVINVATIQDQLGKRFQITGLDSSYEARNLALLLRAGALAAPIKIVEERVVGPGLGQENIDRGFMSVMVGFIAVLIFMAIYYRVFGLFADLALALNLVLVVALLSMIQATLTLPGIAGIVLTVGMAVDANVLIFERIREELKNGNTPQASIHAGYEKAFSTIADANLTTLIAALVLFAFGTGAIKGFAVTLSLGIITSMFTAIVGTRAIVNFIYGRQRKLTKLSI